MTVNCFVCYSSVALNGALVVIVSCFVVTIVSLIAELGCEYVAYLCVTVVVVPKELLRFFLRRLR